MAKKVRLNSSGDFINIEQHFKLVAGPGAGKTRFLINHLSSVRSNSKRLGKNKKIGCITYTNSGVNTIIERLNDSSNNIEVSTIHSFLYKHVVKPYLWVLKDLNFPFDKMDGHEEPKHGFTFLTEFKSKTKQGYLTEEKELGKALNKVRWMFNENKELQPGFYKVHHKKVGKYFLKEESCLQYKELCWQKGIMSHDDVLYFGYQLLKENKSIREVIRAKFPYIFIDEFQDTNPIQSEILKMLGEKETIIGVIGDPAQSIYSFQGASIEFFSEFTLEEMVTYTITDNRRSSNEIIALANHVRSDTEFEQYNPDNKSNGKLKILVGNSLMAYSQYMESYNKDISDWCVISYRNKDAKNVTMDSSKEKQAVDLDLFYEDNERGRMIYFIISALEYGVQMQVKEALKLLKKAYRKVEAYDEREAISDLKWLLDNYSDIYEASLKEFYNQYIYGRHGVKQKVQRGKYKEIYERATFKEFSYMINIIDDVSRYKTIHKVKGEEYNDVFLVLTNEKELDFITSPDIKKEDNRVYYVAITRTMMNLFINVPSLVKEKEQQLEALGFSVVRVE
ncbi:UvrD-helicase domain-containing protein [Virgibacillus flavescens]|uniref:UvrD-helicase domain-containing protein n=1 Tax=Virgibacillus flavescens TaxID=1611422 RepID=UPI003D328847